MTSHHLPITAIVEHLRAAKFRGATLIEINPRETAISEWVDVVVRGKSGEVLPELVRRWLGSRVGRQE